MAGRYPMGSRVARAECRELFRLRNADVVQVFSLRHRNPGRVEVTIDYQRRNRLERTELAGTFPEVAAAIAFVDAQRASLSATGWKRV